MIAAVLPFHIGRIAAEPIGKTAANFYRTIARKIFGPTCELPVEYLGNTIPLYYEMSVNADLVQLAANRKSHNWSEVDVVIIDLTTPTPFALPSHHVIGGILGFISQDRAAARRSYVLLLPMMLAEADPAMKAMLPLVNEGVLAVLSDSGDHVGLPEIWDTFSKQDYAAALETARPQHSLTLQRKFIRYPGHFSRKTEGIHTHCVEFFYDGSLCQRELVELLSHEITDLINSHANLEIFYHSTISLWLERAVLAFGQRIQARIQNLEDVIKHGSYKFSRPVCIIVPLSDTRETMTRLVRFVRKQGFTGQIIFFSILSTSGINGHFTLEVDGELFDIRYALNVEQPRVERGQCPLCTSNVPFTDPLRPDPYLSLSTYAFLKLAVELGVDEEINIPSYRRSVGPMPQFQNIKITNGAYLAYKIHKLLQSSLARIPAEPIILCPDELGATAITDCLDSVFNMTIIRVPKESLNLALNTQISDLHSILAARYPGPDAPIWLTQLRSLQQMRIDLTNVRLAFEQSDMNAFALDDINVTGKTRESLRAFAAAFELNILSYLSVVEYTKEFGVPRRDVLSLYKIEVSKEIEWGGNVRVGGAAHDSM